jgi:hypothetical protein
MDNEIRARRTWTKRRDPDSARVAMARNVPISVERVHMREGTMVEINVLGIKVGFGAFGEIKDIVEVLWKLIPPHIRNQARAKLGDILPLSVIPTNHDLQRAVRIAWVNAAVRIIDAAIKEAATAPKSDTEANQVLLFGPYLRSEARNLEHAELNRNEPTRQSPIDGHIELILDYASKWIGGIAKPESAAPITAAFATTAAALTGVEVERVPIALIALADQGIGEPPRSFGTLLFDELAELIKSERYPEVKEAFRIRLQALTTLQLARIEQKIDETPDRVVEKINREVVPGLADQVAAKVGVSVEQATSMIAASVRQVVAEEMARTQGPMDAATLKQRIDALALTLMESEAQRRPDDAIDAKLAQIRTLAVRGDTAGAAEAFADAWRAFEIDERHARDTREARGQKLLRAGINQAIASGNHMLVAARVIASAALAAGNDPLEQFKSLAAKKAEWDRKALFEETPLNRLVVLRIAEAMQKQGFDPERSFAALSASGRALIDLQFGHDTWKWRTRDVVNLLRRTRAQAVRAMVASLGPRPPRDIEPALTALAAYATDLAKDGEAGVDTLEMYELQSALLVWPSQLIRTTQTTTDPMRKVFNHATLELLARGAGVVLPPQVRNAIVSDAGTRPYAMPFINAFRSVEPDPALAAMRLHAEHRKSWGPRDAAEGIARLEAALMLPGKQAQPAKAVAEVHEALARTYSHRFWWEGNALFAQQAEPHFASTAAYYAAHEPESPMTTIYAREHRGLREVIAAMV